MNEQTILRKMAIESFQKAYSPYSQVKVGCALKTTSGQFFSGCNIENSSFGATVCAERVAVFSAISQGLTQIEKLYVYTLKGWSPCGICRQVIAEFAIEDLPIFIGSEEGESTLSFNELFPKSFSPRDYFNR